MSRRMAFLHLPPIRWLTSFYNPPLKEGNKMTELLKPTVMKQILTHSKEYQRAVKLLNVDWDLGNQMLFQDRVMAADIILARQLQHHHLIIGNVNLDDYQAVGQLLSQHSQWFSGAARFELLKPFNG